MYEGNDFYGLEYDEEDPVQIQNQGQPENRLVSEGSDNFELSNTLGSHEGK